MNNLLIKTICTIVIITLWQIGFTQRNAKEFELLKIQIDSILLTKPTPLRDSLLTIKKSNEVIYLLRTDPDNSTEVLKSFRDFTANSKYIHSAIFNRYLEGSMYAYKGYLNLAIESFGESLDYFKSNNLDNFYLINFADLVILFQRIMIINPEIDIDIKNNYYNNYIKNDLTKVLEMNDPYLKFFFYSAQALKNLLGKEYEDAYLNYKLSTEAALEDSVRLRGSYFNGLWAQGLSLIYLNRDDEGFKLINEAKKYIREHDEVESFFLEMVIGYFLGNYYIERDNIPMAYNETMAGYRQLNKYNDTFFRFLLNKNLYKITKIQGDSKEALKYLEEINAYQKILDNNEVQEKYIAWANEQEVLEKNSRINELELQKERFIRNILIIGLIISSVLILYFQFLNRKLKLSYLKLEEKQKEINQALYKGETQERQRLASELHDNVNTKIAAARWRLEAAADEIRGESKAMINGSIELMQEVYQDVRNISHNLVPEKLDEQGLIKSIKNLVRKLNNKIEIEIIDNGLNEDLIKDQLYPIYNVIFELINNALKHSDADTLTIILSNDNKNVYIEITDDGKGYDENKIKDGFGIRSIKNRIQSMNGILEIISKIGTGTKTTIQFPVV